MTKSFADDPSGLSGMGHDNVHDFFEQEDLEEYYGKDERKKPEKLSYYYDYVAYLHLFLVKEGKKKGFVLDSPSYLKTIKKLKIGWKRVTWEYNEIFPNTNKLSKELSELIVKKQRYDDVTSIVCSQDEKFLNEFCQGTMNHKRFGEIEEYPTCCINSHIENKWHEYEMVATALDPNLATSLAKSVVTMRNGSIFPFNEEQFDHESKMFSQILTTREKFPFVIHQACQKCLDSDQSPTSKLNTDFQEFCTKKAPEIYEKILDGAKGEILRQKKNLSISWKEFDEQRWHPS